MSELEIKRIAELARQEINLRAAELPDEYFYQSLTQCVVDSVFSIGARYSTTQNVVDRYCKYFDLQKFRNDRAMVPSPEAQESIDVLCAHCDSMTGQEMAETVFQNRQRTSPVNGILKSEAVNLFARVLRQHSVLHLQDVPAAMANRQLKAAIRKIPGQKSGITTSYLWMLAGSSDHIKPDRMVIRFIDRALSRQCSIEEAQLLLLGTAQVLSAEYPAMTPRLLDYAVWDNQRTRGTGYKGVKSSRF